MTDVLLFSFLSKNKRKNLKIDYDKSNNNVSLFYSFFFLNKNKNGSCDSEISSSFPFLVITEFQGSSCIVSLAPKQRGSLSLSLFIQVCAPIATTFMIFYYSIQTSQTQFNLDLCITNQTNF
jgi:hypothetical protein